jgi:hypothetical protein
MTNLYPNVAKDLLHFLETVSNDDNPFCCDGRKRNGVKKGKGEAMLALATEIAGDAGEKGFKFLTNNRIETLITVVLQQVPDQIISQAMDKDESHFYNVFDAMGVKLPDAKGKSKSQAATILSTAKDDFNRNVSHIIGSIAEQRHEFLTRCKEGELVAAGKRADRATSREILLNEADRSAAPPQVSNERCTLLHYSH